MIYRLHRLGMLALGLILKVPLSYLIFCLVSLLPRDKNLWLFGSWEGDKFFDNPKYFFLYLNENHPKIKTVWGTKNVHLTKYLSNYGVENVYLNSFKGILTSIRAGVVIFSHSVDDVIPQLTGGCLRINLYHATCPIKKMGFDVKLSLAKKLRSYPSLMAGHPFYFLMNHRSIASSDRTAAMVESALRIPSKHIWVSGNPRNDYQISVADFEGDKKIYLEMLQSCGEKKIIYFVPTFRSKEDFNFFSFRFDPGKLDDLLQKINAVMVFRFHPFDKARIEKEFGGINSQNLIFDKHFDVDPYYLLAKSELLITDYSSIFADFLIFDRPMIFANFDHEAYVAERSLYRNYDEITPGEKVGDWPSILNEIEKYFVDGEDLYKNERALLREQLFKYCDSKNCKRLVNEIIDLIS